MILRESSQRKTALTSRVTSVSLNFTLDNVFYLILFLINAVEKTRPEMARDCHWTLDKQIPVMCMEYLEKYHIPKSRQIYVEQLGVHLLTQPLKHLQPYVHRLCVALTELKHTQW